MARGARVQVSPKSSIIAVLSVKLSWISRFLREVDRAFLHLCRCAVMKVGKTTWAGPGLFQKKRTGPGSRKVKIRIVVVKLWLTPRPSHFSHLGALPEHHGDNIFGREGPVPKLETNGVTHSQRQTASSLVRAFASWRGKT